MAELHPPRQPTPSLLYSDGTVRPIPDPTALTSTLVEDAQDELRREVVFVRQILETRFEALEKAIALQDIAQNQTLPNTVTTQLAQLEALLGQRFATQDQKFLGIATSFQERDVRTEQSSTTTKVAIDAALQAQKEMVAAQNTNIAQALARIEATGQKQIEQLVTLLQTSVQAAEGKISDLKDRLTLIEGRSAGMGTSGGIVAAVIGVLIGMAGVAIAIFKS